MKPLYSKLSKDLGLPTAYVRSTLLPSWWDDDAARTPAGLAEARLFIARHAGIELASLTDPNAKATLRSDAAKTKYKLASDCSEAEVALARAVAEQAARFAAIGVRASFSRLPAGREIRAAILARGEPCVSLPALVQFCWSSGIAVLFLRELPPKHAKMHGMTARVGERPVVVLSRKGHPAWLLFILAHELGHIAHGHIEPDAVLVEESIDEDSDDREEQQANSYAGELLGDARRSLSSVKKWPAPADLARLATEAANRERIDPGHVALSYANAMSKRHREQRGIFYGRANSALKLQGGEQDGAAVVAKYLSETLDWDALPESGAEFLSRVTGASSEVTN